MLLEELDRALVAVVDLELDLDRVGAEEDEPVGGGVLGQRQRAAVHVDDQRRVPVEARRAAPALIP